MDVLGDDAVLLVLQALGQQFGPRGDGEQRVAQVVAEHGNELLAQFGHGPFLKQRPLGALAFSSLSIWIASRRANDSIIGWIALPLSAAGLGSSAQMVPKKLPSVRNTGTEM